MKNQDSNEMLSEHFTLWEMIRSGMAIRMNIDNTPRPEHTHTSKSTVPKCYKPVASTLGMIRANKRISHARHSTAR